MSLLRHWVTATLVGGSACSHGHGSHSHSHGHEGHGHGMHHRFDDAEKWAQVFDAPDRAAWQKPEEVVALLAIQPGMTIADLGAGTGYFLPYLSKAAGPEGRVIGLDTEADMVAYMTERASREQLANVSARRVAPEDPAIEAGSIDRLLIVDTWHHIDHRGAYAAKLAQALKPCGGIYIVDYELGATRGPPKEHRLTALQVAAELREGGLDPEILIETLPEQYVVRGNIPATCK